MGKYIRKAKQPGEVAVMEVTQSNFGVRTRARTLALQRVLKSSSPKGSDSLSSGSYLQLRTRRLEKSSIIVPICESRRPKRILRHGHGWKPKSEQNSTENLRLELDSVAAETCGSAAVQRVTDEERTVEANVRVEMGKGIEIRGVENGEDFLDWGANEASFGENDLDFDGRERSTRESTPCSLIRDPDTIQTPSSTTRQTTLSETNQRILKSSRRHIPTAQEMDEFFRGAEEEQQRQFIEKYNFDPVTDKPLPGRYEWEKLGP